MLTFREHSTSLYSELSKLRRAMRMMTTNPSLIAGDHPLETQLEKMKATLTTKEQSYTEFSLIARNREAQLAAATKNYHILKLKLKNLEVIMSKRIQVLRSIDDGLQIRLKTMRAAREEDSGLKNELLRRRGIHSSRKEALEKEQARMATHTGRFIDTDLWMGGVLQRCVASDLKKLLKREKVFAEEALSVVEEELNNVRTRLLDNNQHIAVSHFIQSNCLQFRCA